MTTLGQEAFRVDPWSFAHAMEGSPLYPNWDADNLTQNSFADNTIKEDIYSAYVQAKFEGEMGGLHTQTVVGVRYEETMSMRLPCRMSRTRSSGCLITTSAGSSART